MGTAAEAASSATAFLALYVMGWQPMLYLVGFNYLKPKCDPETEECVVEELNLLQRISALLKSVWDALNVPMKTGLLAIVLGCTPITQLLLPREAILRPVMDGLESLGSA